MSWGLSKTRQIYDANCMLLLQMELTKQLVVLISEKITFTKLWLSTYKLFLVVYMNIYNAKPIIFLKRKTYPPASSPFSGMDQSLVNHSFLLRIHIFCKTHQIPKHASGQVTFF
jgi:hypothetical protein